MKSCVIFGAGNVGRGFIGHLFSESGYEVVFVDVDEGLIAALNTHHSYMIQLVDNELIARGKDITGQSPAFCAAISRSGSSAGKIYAGSYCGGRTHPTQNCSTGG